MSDTKQKSRGEEVAEAIEKSFPEIFEEFGIAPKGLRQRIKIDVDAEITAAEQREREEIEAMFVKMVMRFPCYRRNQVVMMNNFRTAIRARSSTPVSEQA